MDPITRHDAVVIGAGEAGSVVAGLALDAGYRVALIYKAPYGSTCLNTGCVPSKFLIYRGRVAHLNRTSQRYHVISGPARVDLPAIVREKQQFVASHREESFRAAQEADRLTLIEGDARFVSSREVRAAGRLLTADRIFVATGMRPEIPPVEGLDRVSYLTNETLMDLVTLPQHLIVVGGGYIACELGQTFRRFGSQITIIGSAAHLCAREEPKISAVLEEALAAEGIDLILGHTVVRADAVGGGVRVTTHSEDGRERVIGGTHLLIAAGRRPNTDTLHLSAAGVESDDGGFIRTNEFLETTTRGIWAIGDVNGQQPFTRVCQEEAKIAFANAFENTRLKVAREALGHAIFTDPEIGSVGLTEQEAGARGWDVATGTVSFDKVARAELIGETRGLIKVVVHRTSRRLLGCHMIGPQAAELIYDAILVMRHGGVVDDIATAVGIFPTLQEGVEGTARALLKSIDPKRASSPLVAAAPH